MADIKINPDHIVRGPWTTVDNIPETDIYSFMFRRTEIGNFPPQRNPDSVAFIDAPSGKKITFRELKERVDLLAKGINKEFKIQQGQVVCFYIPNQVCSSGTLLTEVGLPDGALGCNQTWCCAIMRQSILHCYGAGPSTKIVKVKIYPDSSTLSQNGQGSSESSRHPRLENFPHRKRR
jgi:hypothetical protein